jgi:hypothetical protein
VTEENEATRETCLSRAACLFLTAVSLLFFASSVKREAWSKERRESLRNTARTGCAHRVKKAFRNRRAEIGNRKSESENTSTYSVKLRATLWFRKPNRQFRLQTEDCKLPTDFRNRPSFVLRTLAGGLGENEVTVIDFTPTAEADGLKLPTTYPWAKAIKQKPHCALSIADCILPTENC